MPVLEPLVTLAKLQELLNEGAEGTHLDFKRECDLADNDAKLALVKDIAAMQVHGGYLVIGAEDDGTVCGMPVDHVVQYDQATLQAKVQSFVAPPFTLLSSVHEIGQHKVALIYVERRADGFAILSNDGALKHGTGRFEFRKGEVFTRHGSASERWNQTDVRMIVDALIADRKSVWQRETRETLEQALSAQNLAQGPAEALTWQLDAPTFRSAVIEMLRRDDDVPLRLYLSQSIREVSRLSAEGRLDDVDIILDSIVAFAAVSIEVNRSIWLSSAADALASIYYDEYGDYGVPVRGQAHASRVWLAILVRVMALGGMLVRYQEWEAIRALVLRPESGAYPARYNTWLRHAYTMAARGDLFQTTDGQTMWNESLIAIAVRYALNHPATHPDIDATEPAIRKSVAKFDALAHVVSATADIAARTEYWPSYANYDAEDSMPVIERLITDRDMRAALIPETGDRQLADGLVAMHTIANKAGTFWDGFGKHAVEFATTHASPQDPA